MNDDKKYVDLPGLQDYDKGVKDALGKIQTKVNDLEEGVSELGGSMSYYYTKAETDELLVNEKDVINVYDTSTGGGSWPVTAGVLRQACAAFNDGKMVLLHHRDNNVSPIAHIMDAVPTITQVSFHTTNGQLIYSISDDASDDTVIQAIQVDFPDTDAVYTKKEVDNLIPENEIVCINIDRTYTTNTMNALAKFTSKELAQIINAYDSNKSIVLKVSTANETLVISPYISYLSTYDNAQLSINYQFHYIQCNFIKSDVISNPIDDMEWTCSRIMLATQTGLESKADEEHTHDEYYTKEEIDTKNEEFSTDIQNVENNIQDLQGDLDNKANKTHTHELSNITDFFMGSYKEYETAYAAGSIPVGALVIITDDNESDDATSPILGTGKLDSMILG